MDPTWSRRMEQITAPPPHTTKYSQNIIVKTCPLLGRIHFVNDTQGIMALAFVVWYWVYGTFGSYYMVLVPHHADGYISVYFIYFFFFISAMCMLSLIRAATLNPGRVPLIDENATNVDLNDWSVCTKCQRKRPLRAHHCRRCQQCVLRMDHHCPWINNCVGEENHYAFLVLLFWAFWLSFFTFMLCMAHWWVYPKCVNCDREAWYFSWWNEWLLVGVAVNMAGTMGGQMIGQHFNLLLDRTSLDNIANPRPDPDTLSIRGWYEAYTELCGGTIPILWLLPCRRRRRKPVYQYVNLV